MKSAHLKIQLTILRPIINIRPRVDIKFMFNNKPISEITLLIFWT